MENSDVIWEGKIGTANLRVGVPHAGQHHRRVGHPARPPPQGRRLPRGVRACGPLPAASPGGCGRRFGHRARQGRRGQGPGRAAAAHPGPLFATTPEEPQGAPAPPFADAAEATLVRKAPSRVAIEDAAVERCLWIVRKPVPPSVHRVVASLARGVLGDRYTAEVPDRILELSSHVPSESDRKRLFSALKAARHTRRRIDADRKAHAGLVAHAVRGRGGAPAVEAFEDRGADGRST